MIGGVAAGLAEYFNIDATLVRLGFALLGVFTVGFPMILLYIILWVVMPQNPDTVV